MHPLAIDVLLSDALINIFAQSMWWYDYIFSAQPHIYVEWVVTYYHQIM